MMNGALAARTDPRPADHQTLDGKEAKNVAFVQCAGSRDENHLAHCSYICCLASLKQASYVRALYGDSKGEDLLHRHPHPGLYENRFYTKLKADANVSFLKARSRRSRRARTAM